ncbi:hybrid sensor histidine kinase/response regulator [Azohydromonas caseinilytica]|uniref:histidine kinase n=1 Tax=Azohydromonas caseinilytica TaxID=2728836 RepID=A0A848FB29_9BURK|nr:response regulator [Azohydromonas caseinilytica]NML15649.1 response regulator [Azohydromonas caseinilytica]
MTEFRDRPLQVLLLEDSRFDAELIREALCTHYPQARLAVVSNEAGFVQGLRAMPALVLSDYELPGFSGAQALELARALAPGVPFIFVSGVIGEDNAVEMLKRGATDYVSKQRLQRLPVVVERALREVAERDGRDRAERQLREADALFARVVDALHDYAVVVLDTEGRIRSWNRGAQDVFGFGRDQVLGLRADLLHVPEDRDAQVFEAGLRRALAEGKAVDAHWMMRIDGTRLRVEGLTMPLHDDAGAHSGFCKLVHDVTEAHVHEARLRVAKEEAEQANQAKDRFLAMLSHELRTPLTPIASAVYMLEQVAQVPAPYRKLLPMIRRNVALEARLIEDLLDLTSITAGKLVLHLQPVDMHRLVQAVAEMLADDIQAKQLRVTLALEALRSTVLADEARMQQVLWNVVRNAIKFTPEGGHIELRTAAVDGSFTFTCTDDGIGIDAEALPQLFTAFRQAEGHVPKRFGGLGLGLAIARGLVGEHGGSISAASDGLGLGTTVTIRVPVSQQPAHSADGVALPAQAGDDGTRLLLVEDNEDAAEAMRLSLEGLGYRVTHVGTRADALQAAQGSRFDVVLTDLGLPDGSGIDVGRALCGACPVIALSGYGAPADVERSQRAGFSGHVVKPADPAVVHSLLQRVLAQRAH